MNTQYPSVAIPPRLPLVVLPSNRDSSTDKDARLINCYIETSKVNEGELWIYGRPGIVEYDSVVAPSVAGSGVYKWRGDFYSIFGTKLYKNGTEVATGLDDTGGVYQFSQILGATPKMIFGNGVKAYAYDTTNGLSQDFHTIDTDFPATFVKGWGYLQGATYVMTSAAVIWGSGINSVTASDSWNPLDFISAQIEPDDGVALNKQLVYVVAFNEWSTEIFYYNGNALGSALGSQPGAKLSYGCVSADSVQRIDDKLMWLGITRGGQPQVIKMEGLNAGPVSTASIDRILKVMDSSSIYSFQVNLNGHSFYILTFPVNNISLVYDLTEDLWHQWTDPDGNYLPYVASDVDSSGRVLLQHYSNGKLYEMDNDIFNDDGSALPIDIYTPNFDANSRRTKMLGAMFFIGDQTTGSNLEVRWSDDDYQTWTNFRKVSMARGTPALFDCGSFRRRAWNFRHRSNTAFRLQAVEVQYDLGTL